MEAPTPMSKISLSRPHALPRQTLKDRLNALGSKLKEKYSADTSWVDENTMKVKGSGVDGDLRIDADKVDVNIKIGMLLSPLKGKIEESLGQELDKLVKA